MSIMTNAENAISAEKEGYKDGILVGLRRALEICVGYHGQLRENADEPDNAEQEDLLEGAANAAFVCGTRIEAEIAAQGKED